VKVHRARLLASILSCLAGTSLLTGCGPDSTPIYKVTGQVIFPDGSTLPHGGKVVFFGVDTTSLVHATGFFGSDGKFELTSFRGSRGMIAGQYEVSVVPLEPDDTRNLSPVEYSKAMNPIDDRFKNPKASGLRFTVSPETAPHNFRIEVTPPRRR